MAELKKRQENDNLRLTVPEQFAGMRLDQCLAQLCGDFSRSRLQNLIRQGAVARNGAVCDSPRTAVAANDRIELSLPPEPEPFRAEPERIGLDVLYEDEFLLVLNKPAGMVVHPAAGNWSGTLVNALLGRDPGLAADFEEMDPGRPGIVHRLDKDTSGCLAVAKTPRALCRLSESFASRRVSKVYAAILAGHFKEKTGELCGRIGRHPVDRKKMAVVEKGRRAVTHYEVLERFGAYTLVRYELETGRTHQIRVHSAYIHHPVTGDSLYGGSTAIFKDGQLLHAEKLILKNPATGEEMTFTAPLPADFAAVLARLRSGLK